MATSPATDVHFEQRALLRYPPRSIPRSTLHEIKLTRACDLFKKRNFSRQPRSLVSNSIAGICFSCKIHDSVVETLIWNILSVQKMWLRIIKDIYKDCRDVRIFKMECWISYIFEIMHIDFFFSSLWKVYCDLGSYVPFLKITIRGLLFLYILYFFHSYFVKNL